MKKIFMILLCMPFLTGCAIKTSIKNQYKLESFSHKTLTNRHSGVSILVSQPEAVTGYQTEQMLYIKKPFALEPFAHNAWVGAPANMFFPLIMQSLQCSGYFYAVASTPYSDKADYRLDTQLIEFQQNFLTKPSTMELVIKVVLTHVADSRVVASKIIGQQVPCPVDTPYGGVVAANQAAVGFTSTATEFIIHEIKHDQASS